MDFTIPPEVAERLGYYVYLYTDPRSGKGERPFYVGKGKGNRAIAHLSDKSKSHKTRVLKELNEAGLKPRIEILARSLPDGETALRIEAAVIDLLGLDNLTNLVRGSESIELGRVPLEELVFQYAAKPVKFEHSVILIRINQQFRPGMSEEDLYDVTRGLWKLSTVRAAQANYACPVFEGVVREVYEIERWLPAEQLEFSTRSENLKTQGRWGFEGRVAPDEVRSKYRGGSVTEVFPKGAQNPIKYVNC
jgi:hypothetical protein